MQVESEENFRFLLGFLAQFAHSLPPESMMKARLH